MMAPYIFGVRNGVHILDLHADACRLLHRALAGGPRRRSPPAAACCSSAPSGRPQEPVADGRQALRPVLRQPPLARRHADQLEDDLALDQAPARARGAARPATSSGLTKKELLNLTRERDKLERALGGIKDMGGLPDILFVIDTNKEEIAVEEANKLASRSWRCSTATAIPTASPIRSRATTTPCRAINLYCDLGSGAVLDGIQAEMTASRRRCRRAMAEHRRRESTPLADERSRAAEGVAPRLSRRRQARGVRAARDRRAGPRRLTICRSTIADHRGRDRWPRSPPRWSRSCARRPAPA